MSDISGVETRLTIAQAEEFVAATPMSDQRRAEAERQIKAAKSEATRVAESAIAAEVERVQYEFTPLSEDLCRARDDYATLIKAGALGQLTAKEFNERLNAVRRDHRSRVRALDELAVTAERVAGIEADPVAYTEHIYNVTPMVRPTFDF